MQAVEVTHAVSGAQYWRAAEPFARGTFGAVYHRYPSGESTDTPAGAVKETAIPLLLAERELARIKLIKDLEHQFVAPIEFVLWAQDTATTLRIVLGMRLYIQAMHTWLSGLVKHGATVAPLTACCSICQLLEGINYLHEHDIVHCDITTLNILQSDQGCWVIVDLGSAVAASARVGTCNSETAVACRPYEGLVGGMLTPAYDMWSLGAIAAELLIGQPLFYRLVFCAGWSEPVAALTKIMLLLGRPDKPSTQLERVLRAGLGPTLSNFQEWMINFIVNTIQYNPDNRWTAAQALASPIDI